MQKSVTIRALSRGLAVLQAVQREAGLSLHDLSRVTGLAKPTLVRILRTLESEGYVRRGLTDQLYHANLRSAATGEELQRSVLTEVAAPVLDRLCQEVLWPSDLAVYGDGYMHVQETSRRQSPFMMNRAVTRFRIHMLQSGMGRAYLAYCDPDSQAAIIERLANSDDPRNRLARRPAKVMEMLAGIRRKGYATRETGYFVTQPMEARVSAIAVPVMAGAEVLGSINLVWISQAAGEELFVRRHLDRLVEASDEIARRYEARS
ncbi:MAG: helix-turn-helix domain-containing protein [Rhizobiaceae bacterium]|nr:helix-turn-helix domain-containing protein [Rhizobiaceae bacterium]MCV0405638.1 helix-turn-helix domain-containing protein [Rhizobiaceae bacterium]